MTSGLLQDRVAVITGASRGIGLATAGAFATHGARVVLVGRDVAVMEARIAEIRDATPGAIADAVECDVTDPDAVAAAFQWVFRKYRKLDVLVANAGILEDALIGMVTPAQLERVFGVNVYGAFHCAQYGARLIERAGGGSIIVVASIVGRHGNAGQSVYAASKAASIGMTKSLAKELAPSGIRVNAIAPGFIDTDMTRSLPAPHYAERVASIGMGRIGTPGEVANVAVFLASDMSSYVTGETIGVDGGMLI